MDKAAQIVRDSYNHLASVYDEWAESVRVEERHKYLEKIKRSFSNGSRILDLGCGNGLLSSIHLARRFDVSDAFLRLAHSIALQQSTRPSCTTPLALYGVLVWFLTPESPLTS